MERRISTTFTARIALRRLQLSTVSTLQSSNPRSRSACRAGQGQVRARLGLTGLNKRAPGTIEMAPPMFYRPSVDDMRASLGRSQLLAAQADSASRKLL